MSEDTFMHPPRTLIFLESGLVGYTFNSVTTPLNDDTKITVEFLEDLPSPSDYVGNSTRDFPRMIETIGNESLDTKLRVENVYAGTVESVGSVEDGDADFVLIPMSDLEPIQDCNINAFTGVIAWNGALTTVTVLRTNKDNKENFSASFYDIMFRHEGRVIVKTCHIRYLHVMEAISAEEIEETPDEEFPDEEPFKPEPKHEPFKPAKKRLISARS